LDANWKTVLMYSLEGVFFVGLFVDF
jgi:hypothetical protein